MALERIIDAMLQLLFALNDVYFPSRKRTEGYLKGFTIIPENCYDRLIAIIQFAAHKDTIRKAFDEMVVLKNEVIALAENTRT